MIYLKILTIILFYTIISTESTDTSIIQTKSGPIRGEILKTKKQGVPYSSFKGIPYAETPIGSLRFQAPMIKKPWENILEAKKYGDNCTQFDPMILKQIGSEDCLYLNVYTPHTSFTNINDNDLKAVMVWIHGGSFFFGTGDDSYYGPGLLVEKDIVLVTVNYRLGPLGFLNLNMDDTTGNAGLRDQNLALKWVNENIKAFGGNPKKITLFGQSAGGISVDLHLLSEMSAGLFQQSISISGTPMLPTKLMQSHKTSTMNAFKLAMALGIKTNDKKSLLKDLRSVPASDLTSTAMMTQSRFFPTYEDAKRSKDVFISTCAMKKFESGNYTKGPHVIGFTSDEMIFFIKAIAMLVEEKSPVKLGGFYRAINYVFPLEQSIKLFSDVLGDFVLVSVNDYKQKLMSKSNGHPVYYYKFSYSPNNDSFGAGHTDDLFYLFESNSYFAPNFDIPDVRKVSENYLRLITNFAKYGSPTPDGEKDPVLKIAWPDSRPKGEHLEIDKNLSVRPRPTSTRIKMFQKIATMSMLQC